MSTILPDAPPTEWTIADVRARLPGFPAWRIHTYPAPGTATEKDLLKAVARSGLICELIDGTLVEKPKACYESMLAAALIHFIYLYLDENNLGSVMGEAGFLKIMGGQVRAPDVSFIRWELLPGPDSPKPAIYALAPDLAVEILSKGNTKREMKRKLRDYFKSGVRLVWYIEPKTRTARAYTAELKWTDIASEGSLVGADVLPGFELPLAQLFARVEAPRKG